jgi:hypothetical protein
MKSSRQFHRRPGQDQCDIDPFLAQLPSPELIDAQAAFDERLLIRLAITSD